ncbi:hypothetical protein D9M73_278770 [compost metagenome]
MGVVRNRLVQRRMASKLALRSRLNSGQVAMVAIITCIHSRPATPSWRMALRFSRCICLAAASAW